MKKIILFVFICFTINFVIKGQIISTNQIYTDTLFTQNDTIICNIINMSDNNIFYKHSKDGLINVVATNNIKKVILDKRIERNFKIVDKYSDKIDKKINYEDEINIIKNDIRNINNNILNIQYNLNNYYQQVKLGRFFYVVGGVLTGIGAFYLVEAINEKDKFHQSSLINYSKIFLGGSIVMFSVGEIIIWDAEKYFGRASVSIGLGKVSFNFDL